jgi:uncharacterized flavoprotein (TIGR03862 family)
MILPHASIDAPIDPLIDAAIIGAGPAGLMAAEVLAHAGKRVHVFDAMPSVGRKFLLAGLGGLNLTHSEAQAQFVMRYGAAQSVLEPLLERFGAQQLRDWAHGLGVETFVGSSKRVFPKEMKAAPLLRRWLARLRGLGVQFHSRHRWLGWHANGNLHFHHQELGQLVIAARSTVLALGGASWQRLGSDGAWVPLLEAQGVPVTALKPANCGFDVAQGWSEHLRGRFAGHPIKPVALTMPTGPQTQFSQRGEFVLTQHGLEGSLIYAASAWIRDAIDATGHATIFLDLLPDLSLEKIEYQLQLPRGAASFANHLRGRLGLTGVKAALLYELLDKQTLANPQRLAPLLKAFPVTLTKARPIDEAISTAGGVCFEALNVDLMLKARPGVFCAGEMLDWEAPTGGYLLTACMSTGQAAGLGAVQWLDRGAQLRH